MEKIISRLNEIHNISCGSNIFVAQDWKRKIDYTINDKENHSMKIRVSLPYNTRPKISDEIVSADSEFINGFKVVQTANGEFAYIRESDGLLLPYRYDIATRFNQYGFAMVAKDGDATWINTSFQYLSSKGEMKTEEK